MKTLRIFIEHFLATVWTLTINGECMTHKYSGSKKVSKENSLSNIYSWNRTNNQVLT